jgi:hypothetical protein
MDERASLVAGIEQICQGWTALQLAVSHGFVSDAKEKLEWFPGAFSDWVLMNKKELQEYEVEDVLMSMLSECFDVVAEDESIPEIAKIIIQLLKLIETNNADGYSKLFMDLSNKAKTTSVEKCKANKNINSQTSESESDGEMPIENSTNPDPPQTSKQTASNEPIFDDDGFQMVTKKSKKLSKKQQEAVENQLQDFQKDKNENMDE